AFVSAPGGSLSFAPFVTGTSVTMYAAPFTYMTVDSLSGVTLFSMTAGGETLSMVVSHSSAVASNGSVTVSGTGTLSMLGTTNFNPIDGKFSISGRGTSRGSTVVVSFSAGVQAVPGPVVGAGLPGLLAACAGLVALARRRRQAVA